jgi:hypothetical protein
MVDEEPVDHVSFVSVVLISNKPRFPTKTTSELFKKKKCTRKQQDIYCFSYGNFCRTKKEAERLPGRNGRIKAVV